jgi:hypothetical protein
MDPLSWWAPPPTVLLVNFSPVHLSLFPTRALGLAATAIHRSSPPRRTASTAFHVALPLSKLYRLLPLPGMSAFRHWCATGWPHCGRCTSEPMPAAPPPAHRVRWPALERQACAYPHRLGHPGVMGRSGKAQANTVGWKLAQYCSQRFHFLSDLNNFRNSFKVQKFLANKNKIQENVK